MKRNISLDGEDVLLKESVPYLVIDALYLDSIAFERHNLGLSELESELRAKVFPYNDFPFAIIQPVSKEFKMENIVRTNAVQEEIVSRTFSSDTGLIMLVGRHCLLRLVDAFSYAALVESNTALINFDYWDSLVRDFDYDDCALVYMSTGGGLYALR
jgi:hypothetical protein